MFVQASLGYLLALCGMLQNICLLLLAKSNCSRLVNLPSLALELYELA